jgi:hypothetical protein
LVASDTPDATQVAQIIEANSEAVAERFLDAFISEGLAHDIRAAIERHAKSAAPARGEIAEVSSDR